MILVTGANGFIGSRLCQRLVPRVKVRGVVRSEAGAALLPTDVEPVVVPEIAGFEYWPEVMDGVHTVVHLAGMVPAPFMFGRKRRDFERVNCNATFLLARAAARQGVRRLVFLSTAQVHGGGHPEPYRESDLFKPESAYALSKCFAEEALGRLVEETGLETVVLRPPVVYGPGVKGRVLWLLACIARGVPLPFGAMTASRSMISLANLIDVIERAISQPSGIGGNYLVRDGEDITMADLVRRLATHLEDTPNLFSLPPILEARLGRIARPFQVDDGLVRQALQWNPPQTVDEGLCEAALWFRRLKR